MRISRHAACTHMCMDMQHGAPAAALPYHPPPQTYIELSPPRPAPPTHSINTMAAHPEQLPLPPPSYVLRPLLQLVERANGWAAAKGLSGSVHFLLVSRVLSRRTWWCMGGDAGGGI